MLPSCLCCTCSRCCPQMLMQIADDFIDNVVTASCLIAKHRKSNTVEVKDVQLHLGESAALVVVLFCTLMCVNNVMSVHVTPTIDGMCIFFCAFSCGWLC